MRRMKRALSLFLCCVMLMSLVTINTFAAENDPEDKQATVSTEDVQQTEEFDVADTEETTADTVIETTGITAKLFEDVEEDADEADMTEPADEQDAEDITEEAADTVEETVENTEKAATFDRKADTAELADTDAAELIEAPECVETEDKGAPDGTAHHMDIGVWTCASLTVGDEVMTKAVILERSDFTKSNVKISARKNGAVFTKFSANLNKTSLSTGASGTVQFRIPGDYPVGTKKSPVRYTIVLKKNVTFQSKTGKTYTVPMNFASTFDYWDINNDCPAIGLKRAANGTPLAFYANAGLDFMLGCGAEKRGLLSISKVLVDENGEIIAKAGEEFNFAIWTKNGVCAATVSVKTGEDGIGIVSIDLPYGTYYVTESKPGDMGNPVEVDSYLYRGTKINGAEAENLTSEKVTLGKGSATTQFTVENVYEKNTTEVSVTKVWDDKDDQDGLRPETVDVQLLANGEDCGVSETLSSINDWSHTWSVPKYSEAGEKIEYSVAEQQIPEGYECEVTRANNDTFEFTLTNTHVPENPDPVNPDPENPDPVNPDPENPDPENPDPVNPDPENPNPVNPDPVNPNPVNPENVDKEPSTPTTTNKTTTASTTAPKTADTSNLLLWVVVFAVGICSVSFQMVSRRKRSR